MKILWILVTVVALGVAGFYGIGYLIFAETYAKQVEQPMSTNYNYFQRSASALFNGAFNGVEFAPYSEHKSAYNSDLRAAGVIAAGIGADIATTPPTDWMLGRYKDARDAFPELGLPADEVPAEFAGAALATTDGEALYFRFADGSGLLLIEER